MWRAIILTVVCTAASISVSAQTTAFTYQGRLTDAGAVPTGNYDLQFTLWDSGSGGNQLPVGAPITLPKPAQLVTNGIFTVSLDFGGGVFNGADRFLEISVRHNSTEAFVPLTPRQPITSTPYAVRSLNAAAADTATNATQLGGIAANQYVVTTDSRLSDARSPTAGSSNYIQNTTSAQPSSNFNISGNGNMGGRLRVEGIANGLVASFGANGDFQVDGSGGAGARFNIKQDGRVNLGFAYPTGGAKLNIAGGKGFAAGGPQISLEDTNGGFRHWIATDHFNSQSISFYLNDSLNQSGSTAPGVGSIQALTLSNFQTFNPTFSFPRIGIGEPTPVATLDLRGGVGSNGTGNPNAISFQFRDGGFRHWISTRHSGTLGTNNAIDFYVNNSTTSGGSTGPGTGSIQVLTLDSGKVGIGTTGPQARLHINDNSSNILLGSGGCNPGYAGMSFASTLTCSNYSILGEGTNTMLNRPTGGAIYFRENNSDQMVIQTGGTVRINILGAAGSTQLCWNSSNQISFCSSALRYKTNVAPFSSGLSFIKQLQPITFDWKQNGVKDVGFGAEDVARVNPLFVTYNDKGEAEGVKYDRLSAAFVNAFKEQQAEIEQQGKQIKSQQKEIEALKKLVCSRNARAASCKRKEQ